MRTWCSITFVCRVVGVLACQTEREGLEQVAKEASAADGGEVDALDAYMASQSDQERLKTIAVGGSPCTVHVGSTSHPPCRVFGCNRNSTTSSSALRRTFRVCRRSSNKPFRMRPCPMDLHSEQQPKPRLTKLPKPRLTKLPQLPHRSVAQLLLVRLRHLPRL